MHGLQMCPGALEMYRLLYTQGRLCKWVIHKCIVNIHVHALPCLGRLAPRGAVVARHDGLPHQLSPLLPVVCPDLRTYGSILLCDGFPHMLVSDSIFVGDVKYLS